MSNEVEMNNKGTSQLLMKKKQRMKWAHRIELSLRVTAAALLLFFLFVVYSILINIYFDKSDRNFQFSRAVITLVELNGDGLKVDKSIVRVSVSPLLKQSITTKVYRQVGDLRVITGELHAEKSLLGDIHYSIDEASKYLGRSTTLSLGAPLSLIYGGESRIRQEEIAIQQLSHIEDGYVSEMSFTLANTMTPKRLAALLSPYDLWITGMAMYSGEMKDVEVSHYSSSSDTIWFPHLTLRPFFAYSDNGAGSTEAMSLVSTGIDIDMAAEQMMKDLEWLITNADYYQIHEDRQRLDYLRNNGIQVYGAVVTGPVRELEKLKDIPELQNFGLGQIEIWNWNSIR